MINLISWRFTTLSILFILFITCASAASSSDISISELSVLLPYSTSHSKIKFELKATNGCFKWWANQQELIKVEPQYNDASACNLPPTIMDAYSRKDCSQSAFISVNSGPSTRASTFINAEDTSMYNHER